MIHVIHMDLLITGSHFSIVYLQIQKKYLQKGERSAMEIVKSILVNNPCYRTGKKIAVKGLMLHSVGCSQPSAEVFVKRWNTKDAPEACVHAFIDGNSGTVYQTLPWDHRAWHCGGSGNNSYIGVEMCEPSCIRYTGGASFTCSDKQKAMEVVTRTYLAAVELFAALCREYELNPMADGVIISHKEGHDRGIASGHGDPDHLWKGLNCSYSMDTFRKDVQTAAGGAQIPAQALKTGKQEAAAAEGDIKPGDRVSLMPDAVYYGGKEMPDWVKTDHWIVKSLKGDRAVIDQNVNGTKSILSPVDVKYLRKIS